MDQCRFRQRAATPIFPVMRLAKAYGVTGDRSEPAEPAGPWRGLRFAVVAYLLTVAACAFVSFELPALLGDHQWFMSGDVWWTTQSAQWVSHGAVGTVYEANSWYSALPGFLMLYAPVVALGDHLGLVTGYPISLPYPSMWLLSGPFFFLIGSTPVLAVDRLASTLGIPAPRRRGLLVAIAFFVVVPTPGIAGHPEDALAIAILCFSISKFLRGRLTAAAYLLACAVMIQTWAGLAIPVLVLAAPTGRRLVTLLRSAGPPGVCAILLIALDFRPAVTDLLRQPMVGHGQRLPWWYVAGHMTVPDGLRSVPAVVGSSSRWLAVAIAVAAGLAMLRYRSRHHLVAALAVAMLSRGVFETEIWNYYLAAAAVLFVLLVGMCTPGRPRWCCAGTSLALIPAVCWPMAYFGVSINPFIAEGVLVASGIGALAISFRGIAQVGARQRCSEQAAAEPRRDMALV